jgi:hypothetical protein
MSLDWITNEFDLDLICLIRHPAAFVASLRRAHWAFDFGNFLRQAKLMQDWLEPFREQLQNPPESDAEKGALLWTCIYHVLSCQSDSHPDWLVLRLEDICGDPMASFGMIYERLDLAYQQKIRRGISRHSHEGNPVEAPPGEFHLIRRDSRSIPGLWRSQLAQNEIKRIRAIVEPVASQYYTEAEW